VGRKTKLGLLSDIHADLIGLEQALEVFNREGVDHVLCAGDLVDKGEDGDGVVAVFRENKFACILGNHDSDALSNQRWLREHAQFGAHLARRVLNDASQEYLLTLPKTLTCDFDDDRVLIAHGTPWNDTQYVYPTSNRRTFKSVSEAAHDVGANIVLLGHTHTPMIAYINSVYIVNPGSVAHRLSYGSGTCAVLTLADADSPENMHFEVFKVNTGMKLELEPIIIGDRLSRLY
jgi:predicted phosphodiesterase